ncbi:site-specific tyrosine recombinase/integron integrase [Flavobacterium sp.]|uniref:site-specific tyrosine recombinase/integron integrase n=1 Tax=Flavobacterium sp. TaxID=239 RepID=UPI00391A1890
MNISNFTQNYERDLRMKNYAVNTIENYVCQIKMFLNFFSKKDSPKHISSDEIKDYLLTAKEVNSQRHMHSAIKLFYKLTVHQPKKFAFIEYARKDRKLPQPLDASEVKKIIDNCTNIKHKAIIYLLYGCGLRVGEVISLKITDIDSQKMIINIIAAKGAKDRQVMLPIETLLLLREYFKQYNPKEYLFNGQFGPQYSERSINQFLKKYAELAGIRKNIHAHLLRHSFATHALENGTDIRLIQKLLGHSSPKTTEIYTHVSSQLISNIPSPISYLS